MDFGGIEDSPDMGLVSISCVDLMAPPDEISSEDVLIHSVVALGIIEAVSDGDLVRFTHLRLNVEFQWFFIALSVLPGRSFAIEAHLLP